MSSRKLSPEITFEDLDSSVLGPSRGENQARRAMLADVLTRDRDALHRQRGDAAPPSPSPT